jgi:hypothetical protein
MMNICKCSLRCGKGTLKDDGQWPSLLVFTSLYNLLSWTVGWTQCFQWIKHGLKNGMSLPVSGFMKNYGFLLESSLTLSGLLTLRKVNCQVVNWPVERPMKQKTKQKEPWRKHLAGSQWKPKEFLPSALDELNPLTTTWVILEADSSPDELSGKTTALASD